MDAAIAVAHPRLRDLPDPASERRRVIPPRPVMIGRPVDRQGPTGTADADLPG